MVDQRLRKNAAAVFSLKYHVVWCPKYHYPVLVGPVAERLKELLNEKTGQMEGLIRAIEVMPDHVHLFVDMPPTLSPAHVVYQFKGLTSRTLRRELPHLVSRMPTGVGRATWAASGISRTPPFAATSRARRKGVASRCEKLTNSESIRPDFKPQP